MSSSVWIKKDKWFTVTPTWGLWTWIWISPKSSKKYLEKRIRPLFHSLRERMIVVQRKIKIREGSLKETQSWVWQKGVIPHEEKDVAKGSVESDSFDETWSLEAKWSFPACFNISVVLFRYNLLCRLRVFIDRFMLIALSIWCLLFLFSSSYLVKFLGTLTRVVRLAIRP